MHSHNTTLHAEPAAVPVRPSSLSVIHNLNDTDWPHSFDLAAIVRIAPGATPQLHAVPYATGAIQWRDGTAEGFYALLSPQGDLLTSACWPIPCEWFLMAFDAAISLNAGRLDNLIAVKAQDLRSSTPTLIPRFVDLNPKAHPRSQAQ